MYAPASASSRSMCAWTTSTTDSLKKTAGDARLVRDHHDAQARAVESPKRVGAVGIELDPLGSIEIADFFDERAVAVEEHGFGAAAGRRRQDACLAAVSTRSTVMPRMHRSTIGHSRSMHGRHQTS